MQSSRKCLSTDGSSKETQFLEISFDICTTLFQNSKCWSLRPADIKPIELVAKERQHNFKKMKLTKTAREVNKCDTDAETSRSKTRCDYGRPDSSKMWKNLLKELVLVLTMI